jgi:hypothetical protein
MRDDGGKDARAERQQDVPGMARAPQRMQPPSREPDHRAQHDETGPTHQRRVPAEFRETVWVGTGRSTSIFALVNYR